MSFNSYSLDKAYSVLGTWICWKSPNLNHFGKNGVKISILKFSCACILELYNKDKEKVLIGGKSETASQ